MARGMATGENGPTVEEALLERNLAWQVAARLAQMLNYVVGIERADSDTPRLYIELPTGQVSIAIPRETLYGRWKPYRRDYDGHSDEEVRARCERYAAREDWR